MSYSSRQKKRVARAATLRTKRIHQEKIAQTFYLTIATRTCGCSKCGAKISQGGSMVFRKNPQTCLCPLCADSVTYRTSSRWEKAQKRKRN